MTSGLTPSGFVAPTLQDEIDDLNAKLLANVDAGLDLDESKPLGQIVAILAEKYLELSTLGAAVYAAINPDNASGNLLVNACAISGTRPQVPTYSKVTATLTLAAGTRVSAGAVASVLNEPTNTWVLTQDVVNTTTGTLGLPGLFRSSQPGVIKAYATTFTVVQSPAIGWTGLSNPLDSTDGEAGDTDDTLRAKREEELQGVGSGTTGALRARLLEMPGMGLPGSNAFVFDNDTLETSSDGIPAKSIRCVVWDGTGSTVSDATIAATIWQNKPAGVGTSGSTTVAVNDSAGNPQAVSFQRATAVPIYVTCVVVPAPGVTIDATARAAVRAALKNFADSWTLGSSVIALPFARAAIVPGVTVDVTAPFEFDVTASPTNTANISFTSLAIPTLSTTNISVNGSFV
jgi:uncharacterized phage protein gp47/JayE